MRVQCQGTGDAAAQRAMQDEVQGSQRRQFVASDVTLHDPLR